MKKLAIFWLSFSGALAQPDGHTRLIPERLRDPFTSPNQELIAHPGLTGNHRVPIAAKKIKQWHLQGILGNRQRGFWILVVSHSGVWRSLRLNDRLEHYQIIAIDPQQVTFRQESQATSPVVFHPPITLSLVGGINTLQKSAIQEKK